MVKYTVLVTDCKQLSKGQVKIKLSIIGELLELMIIY